MVQVHGKMDTEEDMSQFPESLDSETSFVVLGHNSLLPEVVETAAGQQPPSAVFTSLNNISIVSDLTSEEIQVKLKDLVRENFELKETLQQNNMAMKEQYVLLSNFQEAQWEKTAQMQEAIAQLKQENEVLKNKIQERDSEKSVSLSLGAREDKEAIERLSGQKSCLERDISTLKTEAAAIQAAGLRLRQEKESICSQYQDLLTEVREKDLINAELKKKLHSLQSSLEEKEESMQKIQHDFQCGIVISGEAESSMSSGSLEGDLDIVRGILNKCHGLNNLLQTWSESLHTLADSIADDPTSAEKLKQQVEGVQTVLQKQFVEVGLNKRTLEAAQKQIDRYIEDKMKLVRMWDNYKEEQDQKDNQTVAFHGYELNHMKEKMDSITAHLLEKDETLVQKNTELENLRQAVKTLEIDTEGVGILKAQVELYQTDFMAEREARQRIVGEKEQLAEEHRLLQRRYEQMEEELRGRTGPPPLSEAAPVHPPVPVEEPPARKYTCPKCYLQFTSLQATENHIDECLQIDMFP